MGTSDKDQFFETVLRCVADGVFTVDNNWRITSFNSAAERITGVPAERAIGKRCSEVFHADICEHGCAIQRTLDTGREVIDQPAKILNQRGRSVPISISSAVLRAQDGTLLGAVETFRDLSTIEQLQREGTRFHKEVKTDPDLRVTPVVIVTAVTGYGGDPYGYEKFISHRRLVPPPDGFLPKPIDREEFLATVKELLQT